MSYADKVFVAMCQDILENGTSTEGELVRPHWEDGTSAYTIKKFGVVNRYDLSKEFPAITLRKTYIKSATDELLWIWQKKSNNIHDLKSHVNGILNQRSQDVLAANNWNVCQYAVLMHMLAQVCDMRVGELVHVIADAHIYDRHVPIVKELIERPQYDAPKFWLNPDIKDFYQFTTDDIKITDYVTGEQIKDIPIAV